jgi:biopolymer transport protein ExbB
MFSISATMLTGLILAQTGATPAGGASSVEVQSVWDFVVKGGPMMIPIGLCSLIALTVFVERLFVLRRSRIIPPEFMTGLKSVMGDDSDDRAQSLEYCMAGDAPLGRVFAAAIRRLGRSTEAVEKAVEDAGQREVFKLRKYLRLLSVIAAISPLMGLLGTIFGMIKAFQTVAVSADAMGKTELLAEGIYEAMITTAAGIIVAIPALVAYHFLSARVDQHVAEMDAMTVDFVDEFAHVSPPPTSHGHEEPADLPFGKAAAAAH